DVLAMSSHSFYPTCRGSGLNPEVLASRINGLNIAEFDQLELTELLEELHQIKDAVGTPIAQQALPGVKQLVNMGIGYLSLSRKMATLSGGEAQRVKIARHLGSSLNNMTYIFDEPSAGLHPREVGKLIHMLQDLKANHNTIIVIEHDRSIINIADEIIDMGPGAGVHGGEVIYQGHKNDLKNTPTATSLREQRRINTKPRAIADYFTVSHANEHNLKNLHVNIPKNVLVSVCGVSGSGKSTLMQEAFVTRYPETITVGQASIGISSRSTLATYMGIMDNIRATFSKATGQPAGLFSFNSLGACPICEGKGETTPDVAFADPVTATCEACGGTRYSNEALSFQYEGKNIVEVLALTIDEATDYFNMPKILHKVSTLKDVGLGYLTLGQTTSSLSGGEVQRLKLASHLQKISQIYLLDEPSLGLHTKDNETLLNVLQNLVNKGN